MKTETSRLIRWKELQRIIGGFSRVTVWRWVRSGEFPAPMKVGCNRHSNAWRYEDILEWIDAKN